MCNYTYAQEDLFTALESIVAKDIEFSRAMLSQEEGEIANLQGLDGNVKIRMEKNLFGRYQGLTLVDATNGKDSPNANYLPCPMPLDHYTHPATYTRDEGNHYLVMVGSVLYELDDVRNDFQDFDISVMYIPLLSKEDMPSGQTKAESGGKKKKKSLKDRMLGGAIKLSEAMGANSFVMEQSKIQHAQRIREYMSAMRKIQRSNPYSATTKNEMQKLKQACEQESADIQKFNEDYMKSDEYQEIMKRNALFEGKEAAAAASEVTFKNTGSKLAMVKSASGQSLEINPGASKSGDCTQDWFLYPLQGNSYKKGAKVHSANSKCQGVVEVRD